MRLDLSSIYCNRNWSGTGYGILECHKRISHILCSDKLFTQPMIKVLNGDFHTEQGHSFDLEIFDDTIRVLIFKEHNRESVFELGEKG